MATTTTRRAKSPTFAQRTFDARPDRLDLRDFPYRPPLRSLPPRYPGDELLAKFVPGYVKAELIRNQGQQGACTGFGLACVMNYLLWTRAAAAAKGFAQVSPRMLFEMAKRYDEWPGVEYDYSSCRGALKGLHKHGVCSEALWPYELDADEKPVFVRPGEGWELDAASRPIGVYYRVAKASVVDLQAAIAEIGAVYVSASAHDGWDALSDLDKPAPATHAALPVIAPPTDAKSLGGHAFALVGYDERGFIVQNSWGTGWGASGFAVLPYDDWVEHATDAWALALGVPVQVSSHALAASRFRVASGRGLVTVARTARNPDNPPDDPWPIDHAFDFKDYEPWTTPAAYLHTLVSGNDGQLVVSDYTRSPTDAEGYARQIVIDEPSAWFAAQGGSTLKLAIYAHGGLNSEEESIARIRVLGPYFAANGIYPLFLTWKTGIGETLEDIISDCARKVLGPDGAAAAGLFDFVAEARDRAVEGFANIFAKGLWTQMRQNAEAAKAPRRSMDLLAVNLAALSEQLKAGGKRLEVHLVAHSAGAILLGHLLERMGAADLRATSPAAQTCTLFAAACSTQFAVNHYLPAADNGLIDLRRVWLHYLSDGNEKNDGLPSPKLPAYGKSLLYLVSRALDDARKMPLLGLERSLDPRYANDKEQWAEEELHWVQEWQARWGTTASPLAMPEAHPFVENTREGGQVQATHGSFDNNIAVIGETLRRVRGSALVSPLEWLDFA